jgi:uncharacterized protein YdaU (DUF1376 family)
MAKDPAFLFYSSDFLTGTMTLSFEDRGKFITLLSLMHQQGRIDEETIRLLVGSFSDKLKSKFKVDEKGLFFNERLEIETKKRNKFTESRRNNGILGGRPEKQKKTLAKATNNLKVNHNGNLMEDVNVNRNINKIEDKIVFPFKSENFNFWWDCWIKYRKDIKRPYKSNLSIQAALKNLSNYSEDEACKMIETSIANQWQGIFELKTVKKENNGFNRIEAEADRILRGDTK